MMEFGSFEERLPPFSKAFQTAFSNNEAFEIYIGLKIENVSINNTGMEEIPTAVVNAAGVIPTLDVHLASNQVSSFQVEVSKINTDNSQANSADIQAKFDHLANVPSICMKNTSWTDILSMNIHEEYATNISTNKIYHQTNLSKNSRTHPLSAPSTNAHKEVSSKICSKNANQANASNMHLKIPQADAFHIRSSNNNEETNASERHTKNTTHQAKKFFRRKVASIPCDICDKKFSCPSHLVAHRRSHTGEKPFECKICKKSFSSNWALRRHHHHQHRHNNSVHNLI